MKTGMTLIDWTVIAAYLLAVLGLGVAAGFRGRKDAPGGEGGSYFLAGNTLTWPVTGLAIFAANISTVHLVSLAEADSWQSYGPRACRPSCSLWERRSSRSLHTSRSAAGPGWHRRSRPSRTR